MPKKKQIHLSHGERSQSARDAGEGIAQFQAKLLAWYRLQGRNHLPWRQTDDPYKIWVSEVMLQQTQVQTVLDRFYFPFLERFPTVTALAAADLQEVLTLWQGLGYYNRARNLHLAAQHIVEVGEFPRSVEALMQLPGIGRNTAHAIAAFAFHQPMSVMEANLKRVLSRIFALEAPTEKELFNKANELLDKPHPFDYNQAMMDLGAMLCTPEAPQCLLCPASDICHGKGNPKAYPAPKRKAVLPTRNRLIVLFIDDAGRIHIAPREGRFLHGLWAFPEYEETDEEIYFNNLMYKIDVLREIGSVAHSYSHFHLSARVLMCPVLEVSDGKTIEEIAKLPLSRTEKKIIKLLTA